MTTQTIEVEGLPEGWKAVAYRVPVYGENFFMPGSGIHMAAINFLKHEVRLIVEKIQPRRIVGIDENALNESGWAVISKYVEVVGEDMGGRLFNNLKPLLRIGITEYLSLREVKETDIPLTKDENKLSLSVDECRNVRSLIKDFENLGWFVNPARALLLQKITEFIKDK